MKVLKFHCEKALLQAAVSTASRAVSAKSSIAALEGLLLETGEGTLSVTGYNLETGIQTRVDAEIGEEGALVLPARLFGDIVRRLPDDMVSVSVSKLMVNIRCGQSEFNLIGIDPEEFPELPVIDRQHAFSIPEGTLRAMLAETLFAVSDNESRPIHTGALFEVTGTHLRIVAVDGFRLALRQEPLQESEGVFSFVAPGPALSELEKIARDSQEDAASITMGAKHIIFELGRTRLISRRLEGEFLAWEKAVPRDNPIRVLAETKALLASVERVSLIISERLKSPLRCRVSDGEMFLTSRTPTGDAFDVCLIEGNGQELEIGFNNRYMIDALRAAPAEKICLELSTAISPCVISPAEGEEHFLYMVLPVRLRTENG